MQKKVEQQQWVAFSNKYFKQPSDNPTFQKICSCKKKKPIQANTSNNQNFHVVSFTKNTNKNEKNLL